MKRLLEAAYEEEIKCFFEYNIDSNVHTQTFLHSQYQFLCDLGVYNNLQIIDLKNLNKNRNILLDSHPLKENLIKTLCLL